MKWPYVVVAFLAVQATPQTPDYNAYYELGPDSLPHDSVPKGEMRGPFVLPSQAHPGTAAHRLGVRAGAVQPRDGRQPDSSPRTARRSRI
jgi:hypothetical protein